LTTNPWERPDRSKEQTANGRRYSRKHAISPQD
jgi:hypothetical protein